MSPVILRILQLLLLVLIQAVILFGCAGALYWPSAWFPVPGYLACQDVPVTRNSHGDTGLWLNSFSQF